MELRIRFPDTLAGWRYILRHPKSLIAGRYGYKEFIRQRDIMMNAISKKDEMEVKYQKTVAELIEVRKELSALKRSKKNG
jgi:hypothetical protein